MPHSQKFHKRDSIYTMQDHYLLFNQTFLDQNPFYRSLNHQFQSTSLFPSVLQHVPHDTLDSFPNDITFDINRFPYSFHSDHSTTLSMYDQHDSKHSSSFLIILFSRFRSREMRQSQRGTVESNVTFRNQREVEFDW